MFVLKALKAVDIVTVVLLSSGIADRLYIRIVRSMLTLVWLALIVRTLNGLVLADSCGPIRVADGLVYAESVMHMVWFMSRF